jgi:serine/threonine-protein kinase
VALDVRDQENDIWIWDVARETLNRLTSDPASDIYPVWTPDGTRVVYITNSSVGGGGDLKSRSADGTGTAESLTSGVNVVPYSMSPDGTSVIVRSSAPGTGNDLGLVRLGKAASTGKTQVEPLIQTAFNEVNGEVSPDGRWLAYQSDESSRDEIYVRPFPNVNGGRWLISTAGGTRPAWARNGRELFYFDPHGALMVVPIQAGKTLIAGSPAKLLEAKYLAGGGGTPGRTYDVSLDGQRFLMIKDALADSPTLESARIVVVLNWFEELKARLPAK